MVLPLGASLSPGGSTELSGITSLAPRERERRGREDLGGGSGGSTSGATLMGLLFARLELEATLMGRLGTGVFGLATVVISSDGIAFADDALDALLDGAVVATWGAGGGGFGFGIGLNDFAFAGGRNGILSIYDESLGAGFNGFVGTGRNLTPNGGGGSGVGKA